MSRRLRQSEKPGKEASSKPETKNVLEDVTASELQGVWVGTRAPAIAFSAFGAPVCPDAAGTCIADARTRITYTISGGRWSAAEEKKKRWRGSPFVWCSSSTGSSAAENPLVEAKT